MNKALLFLLAVGLGQLLTGCVVYMPMQCAAPQITDNKQVEVKASTYLNGRVEAAGTYSPVRHLLVHASYSLLRDDTKDTTYYRGNQYDVGVGTYWRLGSKWLVGGLGGFGQARSEARYIVASGLLSFFPPVRHELDVRYNKAFGEVYGVFQADEQFSGGMAYRVTQVDFTSLTDQRIPVDLGRMTRSEPMAFVRMRIGDGPVDTRPLQIQLAYGFSSTFGYKEGPDDKLLGSIAALKQNRYYTTLSISIFPHCLFRQTQSDPVPH